MGTEDKERTQFLTERKYEQVCAGLEEFYQAGDASGWGCLRLGMPTWAKKYYYELVLFKDSKVLIFKDGANA